MRSFILLQTKLVELHEFSPPAAAPSQSSHYQPSQREFSQLSNKLNAAYSEIRDMSSTIAALQQLNQRQGDSGGVGNSGGGLSRGGERRTSQQQEQQQQYRNEGMIDFLDVYAVG